MEKYEKGNGSGRLSNRQNEIPPGWEKGKKGELPNGEIEKGMTSAHLEIGNQPWTFKGIKAEKRGRMKNGELNLLGTIHTLLTIRQNRGTNGSPRIPEFHYKRRERLQRNGRDF